MGCKQDWSVGFITERLQGGADISSHGVNEPWVIEEDPDFVNLWCFRANSIACVLNILSILTTTRITTESTCNEGKCATNSCVFHFSYGIGEQRVPVAIAPIDRQFQTRCGEFLAYRINQRDILFIDWAFSTKVVIVLSDFKHAFFRYISTPKNIF